MRPEVVGELVSGAIPVIAGVYATLLGFRVVGKPPGLSEKYDAWHNRVGVIFRVLGPLVALFGLFQWFGGGSSVNPPKTLSELDKSVIETALSAAEAWKRYTTADGVCSAEFPQPPNQDRKTVYGVESNRLTLSPTGRDVYCMLTYSDLPADGAALALTNV